MSAPVQHPVAEVWPYFAHPVLVQVMILRKQHVLRKDSFVVDPQLTLLLTWRAIGVSIGYLDIDDIIHNSEFVIFATPSPRALMQLREWQWSIQVTHF